MTRALAAGLVGWLIGVGSALGYLTATGDFYEYRVELFTNQTSEAVRLVQQEHWQLDRTEGAGRVWVLKRPRLRLP